MTPKDRKTTLQRIQRNVSSPEGALNVSETGGVHPLYLQGFLQIRT